MACLMSIPQEIRGKIYNILPQETILDCRSVCQLWRQEIDSLYRFHFVIDDKDHRIKWERILQLSIHSIEIRHFLNPPLHGLGTKMFKFPSLIEILKMLSRSILPDNFYYLLVDFSKSLRVLTVYLGNEIAFTKLPTSCAELNLDRLEYLEIILDVTPPPVSPETVGNISWTREPITFLQLMKNHLRRLVNLKLELKLVSSTQVSRCKSEVLNFLAAHWSTLKGFDFELMQGRHGFPSEDIQPIMDSHTESIDVAMLKRVKFLKSIRIVTSSSIGGNYWIDLLCQQTQLNLLETDILQIPISVYKEIAQKNSRDLQIIEITDMKIWSSGGEVTPFDMSLFQECTSLYKIILDRYVNMATFRRLYDCAELINLHLLPESINQISLNYFNVLSEELILLFAGTGKLGSIMLTQCGSGGNFGVNGTVLQGIVNSTSIQFVEISTMNFENPNERNRLNLILNQFGYLDDHEYFLISKFVSKPKEMHNLACFRVEQSE